MLCIELKIYDDRLPTIVATSHSKVDFDAIAATGNLDALRGAFLQDWPRTIAAFFDIMNEQSLRLDSYQKIMMAMPYGR